MFCFKTGCFRTANLQCSGCNKAVFCSESCADSAWVKEKHYKACGDPFLDDGDKIHFVAPSFRPDMDNLLKQRSEAVLRLADAHKTELFDVDDHSIDRDAIEDWIYHLDKAARKFSKWKHNAETAVGDGKKLFIHPENLSFLPKDRRDTFLEKNFTNTMIVEQVGKMVDENTRAFARYFATHLQYVPFDEFLDSSKEALQRAIHYGQGRGEHWARREDLQKLSVVELRMRLRSRGQDTRGLKTVLVKRLFKALQTRKRKRIVWLNYYAMNRSMSYMMLLLYPEVAEQIDALCMTFTEVVLYSQRVGEEVLCLIVDDAAYTGQQLALKLRRFYSTSVISEEQKAQIEFAVVVPYISTRAARELFTDATHMQIEIFTSRPSKLPQNLLHAGVSEKMRTLDEIVMEDEKKDDGLEDLIQDAIWSPFTSRDADGRQAFFFKYGTTSIPIVLFAHKLADRVSVPNFLIAQAPYPILEKNSEKNTVGVTIKHMPLFKNSHGAKFQFKPKDGSAIYAFEDFVQTKENMAPFPPYKNIDYSGHGVDPVTTSLLEITRY